jgi:MFS family permease
VSPRRTLWGYLVALAISVTGTRVSMIAIPWLVLTTTGSPTRTGLVAFAEMAPLVLVQVLSGPLTDRVGARRMAVTCAAGSTVVVGLIPVLHVAGMLSFPALLVTVAVAGALRGPGDAAGHALIPAVVEHTGAATERVTGLAGAIERTASMVGAAVAGGLVALVGPANALVVDAASFALAGGVLWWATREMPAHAPEPVEVDAASASYGEELRAGWSFMRKDAVLMGIGVMVAITNLLDQAWSAVLVPVWARDSGYGVAAVGLTGAVFGGAAILGSVIAATYAERLPRFKIYFVAFILGGVPRFVALALGFPLWAVLAVLFVGGIACGFLNPILGAVLFERIPKALMGRVSSMNLAMSWSLIPFGGLVGGLAVTAIGLSPALLAVGTAYLLTTMLPAVQPRWREIDNREPLVVRDDPVVERSP